jgi:hypothetical protein
MGSDPHASSSSRKRPLSDDANGPSAKRVAPDVPDFVAKNPQLKEQYRAQAKTWFEWYDTLSRAPDNGNQLIPFQGLLDGAKGENCYSPRHHQGAGAQVADTRVYAGNGAEKRLAARLIPRFIKKFPHQVDAAATALLELYHGTGSTEPESETLACKTRLDALRGLSDVCAVAAQLGDKAAKPVLRVVEFLLRWGGVA